jgi:hypothetical protein
MINEIVSSVDNDDGMYLSVNEVSFLAAEFGDVTGTYLNSVIDSLKVSTTNVKVLALTPTLGKLNSAIEGFKGANGGSIYIRIRREIGAQNVTAVTHQ